MGVGIDFGREHLEVAIEKGRLITAQRAEAAPTIDDVPVRVRQALEEPLNFPPLRRALTPDDHITVVVDERLSRLTELVSAVQQYLSEAGVNLQGVTLLLPPRLSGQDEPLWRNELSAPFQEVAVEVHDPTDRRKLSYLANTRAGRRVYLNRTLVDADQLVVLGRISYDPILGYGGGLGDVFPWLSDEATRVEFAAKTSSGLPGATAWPARQEAQEVGWLLGMPFMLQVIEGSGDNVSHILAGAAEAVAEEGRRLLDQHWRLAVDRSADLVVAAISGDPGRHNISDVTRALVCASRVVRPGGRIVVLCRVAGADLGPSMACLRNADSPADGLYQARQQKLVDAANAWQLATAAEQAHIYLLSDIPGDVVEELFATPLTDVSQVQRLVNEAESCLFLPDAHRALAVLQDRPMA